MEMQNKIKRWNAEYEKSMWDSVHVHHITECYTRDMPQLRESQMAAYKYQRMAMEDDGMTNLGNLSFFLYSVFDYINLLLILNNWPLPYLFWGRWHKFDILILIDVETAIFLLLSLIRYKNYFSLMKIIVDIGVWRSLSKTLYFDFEIEKMQLKDRNFDFDFKQQFKTTLFIKWSQNICV